MRTLLLVICVLVTGSVLAEPVARPLDWSYAGAEFSGYVIYDDGSAEPRPGLAMVPNWMGINESAIEKAKAIAGTDYVVLLVDMYGKDVRPTDFQSASSAARAVYADPDQMRGRILEAVEVLRAQGGDAPLNLSKIGAIGFCFGGSTVLELARAGARVSGVVSFHGGLKTSRPAVKGNLHTPILVLNGEADTNVSAEDIAAFTNEMDQSGAEWELVNFPGAHHCFAEADANSPPNCLYHEPSAKRAYVLMHEFFAKQFK
jgi:dienelactone hydrolase